MTPSRPPSGSASGCSAAPPSISRWPPRSSTTSASSAPSARTSARSSSRSCAAAASTSRASSASRAARTFFWQGEYGWDLNSRETIDTQLGVFEGFQPKLTAASLASDVLFLANIQPDLQREVRAQLPEARFVALDSMNLWIDIARDSLVAAIEAVDCVILNDAELRQLTGKPNLVSAAREILTWMLRLEPGAARA